MYWLHLFRLQYIRKNEKWKQSLLNQPVCPTLIRPSVCPTYCILTLSMQHTYQPVSVSTTYATYAFATNLFVSQCGQHTVFPPLLCHKLIPQSMSPTHCIPTLTMPQTYSSVSVSNTLYSHPNYATNLFVSQCTLYSHPNYATNLFVRQCTLYSHPNYAPTYSSVSVSNTLYSHPNFVTNLFVSQCVQHTVFPS